MKTIKLKLINKTFEVYQMFLFNKLILFTDGILLQS